MTSLTIHASCVAIEGAGVLLAGPSGVGKSDVALRLMDCGAVLVSDDQTELRLIHGQVMASPPSVLAGLIELRSVGLLEVPFLAKVPVALYVSLALPEETLERLPVLSLRTIMGVSLPEIRLPAFAASTPAAIRAVLRGKLRNVD